SSYASGVAARVLGFHFFFSGLAGRPIGLFALLVGYVHRSFVAVAVKIKDPSFVLFALFS
ncbi:hypothetical protein, partial [Salmonella sp. s58408]|uniref:hypothetical protein n=1 Tax=Salmonella sp. s58408 TaxID=3159701 RepID=UPI00397F3E23